MAEHCIALNPKDTWGVHALAHCLEMQGKTSEGVQVVMTCEKHWGFDNYLSIHNRWHLSLYHIERCEFDHVLELHDSFMTVTPQSDLMDMHDSAALLWRLFNKDTVDKVLEHLMANGIKDAGGERLFAARVNLIGALPDAEDDNKNLSSSLKFRLQGEVAGMNLENFLVRRKRRSVERFQFHGPAGSNQKICGRS